MFMLEIWINAYNQHLNRAKGLYNCLTEEMKQVANNIMYHEACNINRLTR